ncbi:hypothetical protein BJX70DRAFT_387775 [Aspergillus crustosus]
MPSTSSSKSPHRQQKQKSKPKHHDHPPPYFWDNLPELWLTKSSLREEVQKLARCGGPDLSDLVDYPALDDYSIDPSSERESRSIASRSDTARWARSTRPKRKKSSTVYDRNFEVHMRANGNHMAFSRYPDGEYTSEPDNLDKIQTKLGAPRPSLAWSPGTLKKEFCKFRLLNANARDDQLVIKDILPVLEDPSSLCTGGAHPFRNLDALTDGSLAAATPDFYHGIHSEQLDHAIRDKLEHKIVPTTNSTRPIVPNFFFEAKGEEGSDAVVKRQACYNGALGARATHALQQFSERDDDTNDTSSTPAPPPASHDQKAYTMTTTFKDGSLGLYTTHPAKPRSGPSGNSAQRDSDYSMTQVGKWALDGTPETFRDGITAYRNARDLARKYRYRVVKRANKSVQLAQGQLFSCVHFHV